MVIDELDPDDLVSFTLTDKYLYELSKSALQEHRILMQRHSIIKVYRYAIPEQTPLGMPLVYIHPLLFLKSILENLKMAFYIVGPPHQRLRTRFS